MELLILQSLPNATKLLRSGNFQGAKEILLSLLDKDPGDLVAQEFLAYALGGLGQEHEALDILSKVTKSQDSSVGALYEYGSLLLGNSLHNDAIEPLERAFKLAPTTFEVVHDLATAYAASGRTKDAIQKYELAVKLSDSSSELFYNIGHLYDGLFDFEKANSFYLKALAIDPLFREARVNLGLNLCRTGKHHEGIAILEELLKVEESIDFLYGDVIHAKMQLCSWGNFDKERNALVDGVMRGYRVASPFVLLGLIDDPALHQAASRIYAQSKFRQQLTVDISLNKRRSKIRVGYFSSDFRNHAVASLTAELFELHNKSEFEIYAFSSGVKNNDELKQRLVKAFHEFIDISGLSDEDAVKLSREKGLDIAVDLGGYTENARIGIFERRAAPIQVSYLGYLGTLGAPHMDYIVADHEVIPKECQQFFDERIAFIPNCFQINDRQRIVSRREYTRANFCLPDNQFVFCSFNNSYKINPEIFSSWCRILQRVEGSVLWLYERNKGLLENLRAEAKSRGVNPDSLIFSGILPTAEYLARYKLADLFLDTYPYNGGTTASDALWAGLPVLTRSGKSFPSRMAGSLLRAIDAPELVTHTIAEYENLAVELATDRSRLELIRKKLDANKMSTALFNSRQTTKNIERAYQIMYELHFEGKPPKNIDLA